MDRKTRRWARRVLDTRLAELASLPKEEIHAALDQAKEGEATKNSLRKAETELQRLQTKTSPLLKLAQDCFPNETDLGLVAESMKKVILDAQKVLPILLELADGLTRISRSVILFDHSEGSTDNVIADIRSVLQETDNARKQAQAFKTLDVISSVSQLIGRDIFNLRGLDTYSFRPAQGLAEESSDSEETENDKP